MSKIQIRINHKVVNEFESMAEFMQFLARQLLDKGQLYEPKFGTYQLMA